MEYFDILGENGNKTGKIKERSEVHRDGDLHGTSHIWITRINPETKATDVLLQMRSKNKDSHPSCFDTSCAGHLSAGTTYEEAALRELSEELGIQVLPCNLKYLFTNRTFSQNTFYGKTFKDNQISRIYLLLKKIDIKDVTVQPSEIQFVKWQSYAEVLDKLRKNDKNYCINLKEFETLAEFL